jgi:hypothetical protein
MMVQSEDGHKTGQIDIGLVAAVGFIVIMLVGLLFLSVFWDDFRELWHYLRDDCSWPQQCFQLTPSPPYR